MEEPITTTSNPWLSEPIETFKGMNHPEIVEWFIEKIAELNKEFDPAYITFHINEHKVVPTIYLQGVYVVDKETHIDSDWQQDQLAVLLKV